MCVRRAANIERIIKYLSIAIRDVNIRGKQLNNMFANLLWQHVRCVLCSCHRKKNNVYSILSFIRSHQHQWQINEISFYSLRSAYCTFFGVLHDFHLRSSRNANNHTADGAQQAPTVRFFHCFMRDVCVCGRDLSNDADAIVDYIQIRKLKIHIFL